MRLSNLYKGQGLVIESNLGIEHGDATILNLEGVNLKITSTESGTAEIKRYESLASYTLTPLVHHHDFFACSNTLNIIKALNSDTINVELVSGVTTGQIVGFCDGNYPESSNFNLLISAPEGQTILGESSLQLDISGMILHLIYDSVSINWVALSFYIPD